MSRYAKAGVTIEELQNRINHVADEFVDDPESYDGIYRLLNGEAEGSAKVLKDISKIDFSCENVSDPNDLDDNFDMPGFEGGFELLPNGVPVAWVGAGGDWEDPLALCVYIGEHNELRAYIPKDGNCYNFKTKSAFGNWYPEDGEDESEDEDFSEYEENCECDHHFGEMKHFGIKKYEFVMNKLRADAAARIIFKE